MINRVCHHLMTRYPDIPVLTVHDSIPTTERHMPLMSDLITRTHKAHNPFTPKLRIT